MVTWFSAGLQGIARIPEYEEDQVQEETPGQERGTHLAKLRESGQKRNFLSQKSTQTDRCT